MTATAATANSLTQRGVPVDDERRDGLPLDSECCSGIRCLHRPFDRFIDTLCICQTKLSPSA